MNKLEIKESNTPEYSRAIRFEYEGEEYYVDIYVGKHCSDYTLYKAGERIDKPAWIEEAESKDDNFNFLWFIDELAWEYDEQNKGGR